MILIYVKIWFIKNFLFPKLWRVKTSVIFAQSCFETGYFTSNNFLKNKNLFGMKAPNSRKLYISESENGFAIYKSHYKSIIDYLKRQIQFNINTNSTEEYINSTQNSNYSSNSSSYVDNWKSVLTGLKVQNARKSGRLVIILSFISLPLATITAFYFTKKKKRKSGKFKKKK